MLKYIYKTLKETNEKQSRCPLRVDIETHLSPLRSTWSVWQVFQEIHS